MANTYHLCGSLWNHHPFLSQYFDFDPKTRKLERKYKAPKGFTRVCQQYRYYRWRFPGDVLFFQVGRFFEFYHKYDKKIAQILDLAEMRKNRRGARYGFPVNLMNRYFQTLLKEKDSIVLIPERERYWTGI